MRKQSLSRMLTNTLIIVLTTLLSPTAGGRIGEPSNFEVVSSEPLTFEPAEEVYPDRRLFQAKDEGEALGLVDEIELNASDLEEEASEVIEATGSQDASETDLVGERLLLEQKHEVFVDRLRLKSQSRIDGPNGGEESELESASSVGEDATEFEPDLDYDSSEWDFEYEGDLEDSRDHEPVSPLSEDEIIHVKQPIARRLRRITKSKVPPSTFSSSVHDEEELSNANKKDRNLQGCKNVKIEFKVDKFGKETTVELLKNGNAILQSKNEVEAYQTKVLTKCVNAGTYTLSLKDTDGFCCKYGQGYYKLSVDGELLVSGGYFIGTKKYTIKVGHNPSMNSRDKEWLAAHNARRRTYHQNANKSYRALKWSTTLKNDAMSWAKSLLGSCNQSGIKHEKGIGQGENLAKNKGAGAFGKQYPANDILKRWVENESTWNYPKNAHLTQVVWRPTSYVGCADASKSMGGNQMCHIQVCRYMRPGNCAVKNGNWKGVAFEDESKCGDSCPSEGCY